MRQKKLVYYGKKCLIFLISVFILSVAVFYVARLAPGDPLISECQPDFVFDGYVSTNFLLW